MGYSEMYDLRQSTVTTPNTRQFCDMELGYYHLYNREYGSRYDLKLIFRFYNFHIGVSLSSHLGHHLRSGPNSSDWTALSL